MSLHDEKAAALAEVLAATGEEIIWKGRTLQALVSDNPLSQDLGSFENYANHLGIGHLRFEKHMPETAMILERAEREKWSDEKVAAATEIALADVPEWRKRYRDAVEVVDEATPARSFRNGVRQTIARELERHHLGDAEIESVVTQVCYRAADLAYLLAERRESLSDYSVELREEDPGGESPP